MTVTFTPISAGAFNDSFDIPSTDPTTSSVVVSLSGTGKTPPTGSQIVVTDPVAPTDDLQVSFGNVNVGLTSALTITVSNGGSSNLVITTIASANPLAAPFSITADNCSGKTIATAGSCTLTLQFAPISAGTYSGSFDIPSNDTATPSAVISVSGGTGGGIGNNSAPTAPVLVSPTDGQTGFFGTVVSFVWSKSTDPDNDPITYHLYYSTDSTFASTIPVDVASRKTGMYFAGSGLLLIGFVAMGRKHGRMLLLMLMIASIVTVSSLVISCGGGSSSSTPSTPDNPGSSDYTQQVTGLSSGSTYYWKVVADDGKGGQTSSAIWSFKTM